jgi:hypothetical protein
MHPPFTDIKEEKFFFPECEKRVPGSMTENEEQHKLFQIGLDNLEKYASQVQRNPNVYNGDNVISLIEEFGAAFCRHLHDEIPTMAPDKMKVIFPVEADLKKNHNAMMKWTVLHSSKLNTLPWVPP